MKLTKVAIIVLLTVYGQLSMAQITDIDTVKRKVITLNEVLVAPNKTEETRKTVAQQTQVITGQEIADMQAQSTADVIANTGNVMVQKSQLGGGSPVIRGFEASRILLVVDGVRMNNLIYRAGHLQNIVTLDNSMLSRVEILFGPSSTRYGSDALGGVISLSTKSPLFADATKKTNVKINAFTRYGCVNDEMTGHLDFNIGGKKFASLTSVTYSQFGDLKGGRNQNPFYDSTYGERPFYAERINDMDSTVENSDRYLQVQSGYTQYDILQKFAYKQNEHAVHQLNFQYSNSTDVPRYDRLTEMAGGKMRFGQWYYGPQMRMLGAYDFNYKNQAATFQQVHFGLNYQSLEESRHDRRFGNKNLNHRVEKVGIIGANLDFQKTIKSHSIRFGLDGQYNMLTSTAEVENILTGENDKLNTRYPDGDNTLMDVALYISHTWKINDQLTLTDGLRGGIVNLHSTLVDTSFFHLPYSSVDQNNTIYSGSLGLIHTPSDDLKLSLLASTGYRAPNVDDLSKIFESATGSLVVPNPDLKPEKTFNTEAGITKVFNGKTRWENAVYYTIMYDAIVTDVFQFNGEDSVMYNGSLSRVLASQNKQEAYIYGFSSNLESQLSDNFLLSLFANYTYGRVKTDSSDVPLDHISPFTARLQLAYNNKKFSSAFFINYNGAKKLKDYSASGEDNLQYATPVGMPAWYTVNLHASYKVFKYITLQAGVDNIFDTQYRVFASGINGPGRNFYGAIRFTY